jgi:hypothetical protein
MRMRWRGGLVAHPSSSERCGARRWGGGGRVTRVENAVHNSVPVAFWALYNGHALARGPLCTATEPDSAQWQRGGKPVG